jgi:thiamine biosynthesis lipoprotein
MPPSRQTRRKFLQGHATAHEFAVAGPENGNAEPIAESAAPAETRATAAPLTSGRNSLIVSVRRRAMACEFEVQLAAARDDDSMEHVFAALDLVEALEAQLTIYRDDSEVIRINQRAATSPVKVEARLFALLKEAARLHQETDGALDITSGPLSDAWGFSRRSGRVPSDAEIESARQRVGMQHVTLDDANRTISFSRPGVSINLNSLGKGYALDRMAEILADQQVGDYLIHGGKSSVLARGTQPGSDDRGWRIGLRHPLRPAEPLAEFILNNKALSTSGSGTQFFIRRGQRYGHILDPRTGRPAEGLYSATVIAPTAAEAEGLSTAFYVMGPQKTGEFCAQRPELAALLVGPSEREGDVRLYTFGLDEHRLRPSSGL